MLQLGIRHLTWSLSHFSKWSTPPSKPRLSPNTSHPLKILTHFHRGGGFHNTEGMIGSVGAGKKKKGNPDTTNWSMLQEGRRQERPPLAEPGRRQGIRRTPMLSRAQSLGNTEHLSPIWPMTQHEGQPEGKTKTLPPDRMLRWPPRFPALDKHTWHSSFPSSVGNTCEHHRVGAPLIGLPR